MALPTSGQLSLSDIATELSVSLSNVSLRSMSSTAGFSQPDAVTEFYGYSAAPAPTPDSTKYWDFSTITHRLQWGDSTPPISGSSETISFSFWYKVGVSTKTNLLFVDLYPDGATTNANRLFISYSSSVNRIITRYRSNSVNFDKQFPLHNSSSATGITSSTTGWCTAQRGNVNGDDFTHIVVTYDGSQSSASSAFKLYWNATEISTSAISNSGTRTNFDYSELTWNNDFDGDTGDPAGMDGMRMYGKVLTQSEISDIYGQGSVRFSSSDSVTTDLIFEDRAQATTPVDSTGTYSLEVYGGTLTNL